MKLTLSTRSCGKKSALKQMRHEGQIPAVMYRLDGSSATIALSTEEFESAMRAMKKEGLSTQIFDVELEGKKSKAIVKDIAYHRTTYKVLHLDFQEVDDNKEVNINVPVVCHYADECIGVKHGGGIKRIKRKVPVRCLVKDLPEAFCIDTRPIELGQVFRIRELQVPKGVSIRTPGDNVLISVSK